LFLDPGQWRALMVPVVLLYQKLYTMTSKTKTRLQWLPLAVFPAFLTFSIIMKFAHMPQLVALYSKVGFQDHMVLIGMIELLFLGLFLWSKTMRMGFFLFTAYYGGAIGIEISLGMVPMAPAIILTVIWISTYLRNPALFYFNKKQTIASTGIKI
jgi:hypothetical protein